MSALPGETKHDWFDGRIAYQHGCPLCDMGLIYAPVRFCSKCGGSGYLLRFEDA